MAQSSLFYNKTIPLDPLNFIQVQAYSSEPGQIVLKHAKKQQDGSLDTLAVFKFPLKKAVFIAEALTEAQKEVVTFETIRQTLIELCQEFPVEKIEQVLASVRAVRLGMP